MTAPLLEVSALAVSFRYRGERVSPIERVSFSIAPGESVGIVGESGSGKTTLGLALMRLTPPARDLEITGRIAFEGRDVLAMPAAELSAYRGAGVAMIPQDPMTSLNPTLTIGRQVGEAIALDRSAADIRTRAVDALRAVRLPEPEARLAAYPHHLSGGMRQRAVGAVGIARAPKLLIADEPTTALDVTVQRQFLDMLADLQAARGMALLLISHDLGVVARLATRIIVMYGGEIVEDGPARDILDRPRHWYTAALVASARGVAGAGSRLPTIPGQPPGLIDRPRGCRFAPRCPNARARCAVAPPIEADGARRLRCWFPITEPAGETSPA
jgi:oligopeptide/dipeptide ABC transporter ATP-binding protein